MKILAKNYNSRDELEKYVGDNYGLTTENKEHTIEGTRKELIKLNLSGKRMVWGIKCVETDPQDSPPKTQKPQRGEIFEHGINLPTEKINKKKNG